MCFPGIFFDIDPPLGFISWNRQCAGGERLPYLHPQGSVAVGAESFEADRPILTRAIPHGRFLSHGLKYEGYAKYHQRQRPYPGDRYRTGLIADNERRLQIFAIKVVSSYGSKTKVAMSPA